MWPKELLKLKIKNIFSTKNNGTNNSKRILRKINNFRKNYFFAWILIITSSFISSFKTEAKYSINEESQFPIEFKWVIASLNSHVTNQSYNLNYDRIIKEFNIIFPSLPKHLLFFTIKAQIIKSLIEYPWEVSDDDIIINKKTIKEINDKLMKGARFFDSFVTWTIESLQTDLWEIFNIQSQQERRAKLEILKPLLATILTNDAKDINQVFIPFYFYTLENINITTSFLSSHTYGNNSSKINVSHESLKIEKEIQPHNVVFKRINENQKSSFLNLIDEISFEVNTIDKSSNLTPQSPPSRPIPDKTNTSSEEMWVPYKN